MLIVALIRALLLHTSSLNADGCREKPCSQNESLCPHTSVLLFYAA